MAYSLHIRDVETASETHAPWLDGANFPFPEEAVREIVDWKSGYRDRYVVISLGELRALPVLASASIIGAREAAESKERTEKWPDDPVFLLHWAEWDQAWAIKETGVGLNGRASSP